MTCKMKIRFSIKIVTPSALQYRNVLGYRMFLFVIVSKIIYANPQTDPVILNGINTFFKFHNP